MKPLKIGDIVIMNDSAHDCHGQIGTVISTGRNGIAYRVQFESRSSVVRERYLITE